MNEQRRLSGLAERIRTRLKEFDDTLSDPTQAQDIAEMDLLNDVWAILEDARYTWEGGVASEDG